MIAVRKTTSEIQSRIIASGFSVGPSGADGVWGRGSIAGAKAFQQRKGLYADGVVGPKTLALLFPETYAVVLPDPPWFVELGRKLGLREKLDNAELRAWLNSDGHTLGDPAVLPWCGDAVETSIALTCPEEILPANPYYALNWKPFGVPLREEQLAVGAILVFFRDGGGHVGFYVGTGTGTRAGFYRVRGGNQSDSICETWVAIDRCVARRWPKTYTFPASGPVRLAIVDGVISRNEA